MRANYRNLLAQCGINDVQPVATAAAALRKLQERPFDLILCEYHLGEGQDGQHLLEDMRIHRLIPLATVFVMVTGESSYERVVSAVELAPNDYILKPFAADVLFQRLSRAFDKRDAFLKTYQFIEIGNLEAAVASCVENEQLFPQYAVDFLHQRAELLVSIGRPEQAHEIYQRVIEARALPWAELGLASATRRTLASAPCRRISTTCSSAMASSPTAPEFGALAQARGFRDNTRRLFVS